MSREWRRSLTSVLRAASLLPPEGYGKPSSSAPPHLRATLQSVFLSCMASGMLVGFVVGGRCFEVYGGGTLYAGAALLSLSSLLFFLPLHLKRQHAVD